MTLAANHDSIGTMFDEPQAKIDSCAEVLKKQQGGGALC
jgi:hypothetical protein